MLSIQVSVVCCQKGELVQMGFSKSFHPCGDSSHAEFKGAVSILLKHLDDNNLKLLLNPLRGRLEFRIH